MHTHYRGIVKPKSFHFAAIGLDYILAACANGLGILIVRNLLCPPLNCHGIKGHALKFTRAEGSLGTKLR